MRRWVTIFGSAVALVLAASPAFAAGGPLGAEANAAFMEANAHKPGIIRLPDGLQYRVVQAGYGKHPSPQDTVTVLYSLSLISGSTIQGTEPDFPARFKIADLIAGWKEALLLMREGDHWSLVVPANLGYGPRGTEDGSVPPNQTLVFDIQLLKTEPPPVKQKGDDDDDDSSGGH